MHMTISHETLTIEREGTSLANDSLVVLFQWYFSYLIHKDF